MTAFAEWDREVGKYDPPKEAGKSTDHPKLPPGEYQLLVEECRYFEGNKGAALIWKFVVPAGAGHPREGQHHEHFVPLYTAQNRNYAFNDLLTARLPVRNWTEAVNSLKELEGRVLAVKIFVKDGYVNMFINAFVAMVDDEIPF